MRRLFFVVSVMTLFTGCLKLQKSEDYSGTPIDPYKDVTCWEFINSRPDLFSKMIDMARRKYTANTCYSANLQQIR